jgi:hypothetical protein
MRIFGICFNLCFKPLDILIDKAPEILDPGLLPNSVRYHNQEYKVEITEKHDSQADIAKQNDGVLHLLKNLVLVILGKAVNDVSIQKQLRRHSNATQDGEHKP